MGRPRVAAIATAYFPRSHADVIVTKLLEGYDLDGIRTESRVEVASLYLDQIAPNDVGLGLASARGVPLFDTVGEAVAIGHPDRPIDGVLVIGEHGDYPRNELGQKLYPRRRLFDAAVAALVGMGRSVPIFVDKHLSWSFSHARRMYDSAVRLGMPLLAGSSLPLSRRAPSLVWPLGVDLDSALAVGYGDLEGYGFHALETLQCMVERRRGGESGVAAVQCLEGDDVWRACDEGQWDPALLDAALATVERQAHGLPREQAPSPAAFLVTYRDGLRAAALMLDGATSEFAFAGRAAGAVDATCFRLQNGPPFDHFTFLVRQIESMVLTGTPPYPVERTLLTTGVLHAAMRSRHLGHVPIATPELAFAYTPPDRVEDTGIDL